MYDIEEDVCSQCGKKFDIVENGGWEIATEMSEFGSIRLYPDVINIDVIESQENPKFCSLRCFIAQLCYMAQEIELRKQGIRR